MYYVVVLMSLITLLLFWGCVKTYSINGKVFVDGMGFRSFEFYWWIVLATVLIVFVIFKNIGKWVLLIYYLLWVIALFMNHWKFYFFGATEKKIKGYNTCFNNTIKVLQTSEKRVVPDLYHIILSVLVASDLLIVLLFLL